MSRHLEAARGIRKCRGTRSTIIRLFRLERSQQLLAYTCQAFLAASKADHKVGLYFAHVSPEDSKGAYFMVAFCVPSSFDSENFEEDATRGNKK